MKARISGGTFIAAAAFLVLTAGPVSAFPPARPPSYSAVYQMTTKSAHDTHKATVTIAMAGDRSSWKHDDGQVSIHDTRAKTMTSYGGPIKGKVAQQSALPDSSNWEFGYQTLASDSNVPPKEGGKGKYAGEECTIVHFETRKLGTPDLCITDKGIVARYFLHGADGTETTFEAQKITIGAPAADALDVPKDLDLQKQ